MSDQDLISFLTSRLDEDEKLAMEAADEGTGVILGRVWAAALDAKAMAQQPDAPEDRYLTEQKNAIEQAQRLLHLGDPDRALREIEAKRKLVGRFRRAALMKSKIDDALSEKWYSVMAPNLVDLAAVYRDHPDYRSKWFEE